MKSAKAGPPPCRHNQSNTPYRVGGTEKWFALVVLDRSSTDRNHYHLVSKQSIIPTSFAPLVPAGDVRTINRATGILHSPCLDSRRCATVLQPLCSRCSERKGSEQGKQVRVARNYGQKALLGPPIFGSTAVPTVRRAQPGDQRLRQSMSSAVSKKVTARAS